MCIHSEIWSFQFSKWLCLDKNNNLGISVALLFLNDLALTLRAIQSSFMVYKWTMAMQFSFEYCIDPKDHKSEEDIKAICSLQESLRHVL